MACLPTVHIRVLMRMTTIAAALQGLESPDIPDTTAALHELAVLGVDPEDFDEPVFQRHSRWWTVAAVATKWRYFCVRFVTSFASKGGFAARSAHKTTSFSYSICAG
jgi:hypothetical protein